MTIPEWLEAYRSTQPHLPSGPIYFDGLSYQDENPAFMRDIAFNRHSSNDGSHVSPYDSGTVHVGLDGLEVRLVQGVDEDGFKRVLSRTLRATTGISPDEPETEGDWEEMMRGGLQSALESQVLVFEVHGASRALTHQLVRTRNAAFHQQSQRATWYGDRPDARWPVSVFGAEDRYNQTHIDVQLKWEKAQLAAWEAYQAACDAGISYQDARYILPEGTVNYIVCEYTLREFINVYAYRACSMFLWEMVGVMREMRRVLLEDHPFLAPYVKISCEKGPLCKTCKGSGWVFRDGVAADESEVREIRAAIARAPEPGQVDDPLHSCVMCGGLGGQRKCTFQGWENVEGQCDFPWAKQDNRVFLPAPKYRIGK